MKSTTGIIAVPALFLLMSCSTGGMASAWTHTGLGEAQRQQQADLCLEQAIAAEKAFYESNARGDANSSTPFINNLKVRQRSMAARNEAYAACMQAAGFTRQQ